MEKARGFIFAPLETQSRQDGGTRIRPRRGVPRASVAAERFLGNVLSDNRKRRRRARYQPQASPWFCSRSHLRSGSKYSRIAFASARRSPAIASIASGQGRLPPPPRAPPSLL